MPAPDDSILNSVLSALGMDPTYEEYNPDIILHINSVFNTLTDLGVPPANGFEITDATSKWQDYLQGNKRLNECKTYMVNRLRLIFDPPKMGYLVQALKDQIKEAEFRINVNAEQTTPQEGP